MKLSPKEKKEFLAAARDHRSRKAFRQARESLVNKTYDEYLAALDDFFATMPPPKRRPFLAYRFNPL